MMLPICLSPNRQAGLSLVELMIAMVLGLVLTGGVVQIFTSSGQAYRTTDSLSQLQENLRFTLTRMQYDVRRAGYRGCLIGNPVNQLDPAGKGYTDYVHDNRPVLGWDAVGTGIGDSYTISDSNTTSLSNGIATPLNTQLDSVLPGSDVVVINTAQSSDIILKGNTPSNANALNADGKTGVPAGEIIMVVNDTCTGGDMFQNGNNENASSLVKSNGNSISPGNLNPTNDFSQTYNDDASVYVYSSSAYYIGTGSSGEPSLFMKNLAQPSSSAIELVEGVENMQILYGVNKSGGGSSATEYLAADDVKIDADTGVNNWDNVVSIRLSLLLRSEDNIEVESSGGPYNLLGTQVTTATDRRVRMAGVVTVGIRNRLN